MKQLCIDLGSAYTKLAIRDGWNATAELVRDGGESEWDFCIPSTIARIDRKGTYHWLIGNDALAQPPADNVAIYSNWKARIFSPEAGEDIEAAAGKFFEKLAERLRQSGIAGRRPTIQTRLCIPKLPNSDVAGQKLQRMAESAGFVFAKEQPLVYEPEANVCGILTRGINATWRPKAFLPLHPSYYPMFQDGARRMFAALKAAALPGALFTYKVLVVDVGSFTTDMGLLTFEVRDGVIDDFHKPEVIQESKSIGIRQLDDEVLNRLPVDAREAFRSRAANEWESAKRQLYSGQPIAVRSPKGGILQIGKGVEASEVRSAIDVFSATLRDAIAYFCEENAADIDQAMVTGGGVMIHAVRQAIVNAVAGKIANTVTDLLDPDEYVDVLPRIATGFGPSRYDPSQVRERRKRNRELSRGGSAIGGCSVFIDLPSESYD